MIKVYDDDGIQLYHADWLELAGQLDNNSVDIIATSPPYWNQREYSFWPTYEQYLADVNKWVEQCARVLRPGRHCFWVIPDKLPWPPKENGTRERLYKPIYADTEAVAANCGLVCKYPIIWKKPHGTQKMFGSYPYPPTIIHTPMTERICIWRKPGKYPHPGMEIKRQSEFTKQQWVDWAQDLWEITPETSSPHPAPFPEEIPLRILTLWSFVGDIVVDPFAGWGTTLKVAADLGRKGIGCDLSREYVDMGAERLSSRQPLLFTL
jgi:DNA modification methylase